MDLNRYTVPAVEEKWIDGPDGSRFLIRSSESSKYKARLAAMTRQHNPARLKKDHELQQQIASDAMAEAILIDFEGITHEGRPVANTLENRRMLLNVPEIRDLLSVECQDLDNFRREGLAADAADLKSDD